MISMVLNFTVSNPYSVLSNYLHPLSLIIQTSLFFFKKIQVLVTTHKVVYILPEP